MKFRKTVKRDTYKYHYTGMDGRVATSELVAGEDEVTDEYIKMLHALDDGEVYNNIKNCKVPMEPWQKKAVEAWKKENPNKDVPKNWVVSLNSVITESEEETEYGAIVADPKSVEEEETDAISRLHVVVSKMTVTQQVVYQKFYIEGKTKVEIADEVGKTEAAIRKTIKKIEAIIADDEILKKFFV